ncbi:glutamine amidotransferase-related protein [Nocardioides speluncae]|uniref:glutamine amidotransferase-related protein n=1 Tax=Nocardioides speluncae TaxID=2670337 RepID=UPI000D68C2E3|nr:CTP synthase [Nocardioides speluncae]
MSVIALLGDESGHISHRELNALRPRLRVELGVESEWVPTDAGADLTAYDGIWLVPGSPYADDAAVYRAIGLARQRDIPFLGTCGGMQYAVIELARTVLGLTGADHAESDGESDSNVVVPAACSLYGEERLVTPVPGSRFAELVAEPFVGMHYCSFLAAPDVVEKLVAAGAVVGATAEDAGVEVLEWPANRFFMVSMFQPHIGASTGAPVHPLVAAFVAAVQARV